MKYVCVVPYTYQLYLDEFLATCKIPRENMLLIDNTTKEKNIGCMASHNKGVEFMYQRDADYLIIISPAIRFGKEGGLDFIKVIEEHNDHHVIHAASANVAGGKQSSSENGGVNEVFGWHLTAFRHDVFTKIGLWDNNFAPYGFDDIDLSIRIRKGIPDVKWDTYPCDVHDTRMSHSLNLVPDVVGEASSTPRIAYFERKWGRHPGEWQKEAYDHPFNDPDNDLAYWPTPDDLLSIQSVEFAQ